ncbi:hypothetical protein [Staphylococcus pseudoxylosus]|uniref:DUF3168 domain-containing protein n=1 Tax=Staphylococcus pseudoxylosus TaxID=2282419 RepID=A0AAQ0MGT5_9STAP|nr:hypothetical protein [Staphylococcus pseudoxylosus]MCE5003559.1 hypothetical protein [Staphylococcus pseudoxylosus]MEB6046035.1 hypothetical protein [Staphylococcus pseudoxylosus]RMI85598.1 hypothetical protein D9V42_04305 [Staphylococcus pseudoxylosus]
MNILTYIREIIIKDEMINTHISNRIYFYEASENADTTKPFIILSPVVDSPSSFASNKFLSETFTVQVDVETYKDQLTIDITKRIRFLLKDYGFYQSSSLLDAYFKETKRYIKSRRYEGIPKNKYYKGERVE